MSASHHSVENKRPLSPHLSVYNPQITSVLSISHRLTGLALYLGAALLAVWIMLTVYGCADCVNPLIFSPFGLVIIGAWSFAFYYHMLNGIRHLFWDIGKGYEISTVTKSGIAVVIGAVALTAGTWACILMNGGAS